MKRIMLILFLFFAIISCYIIYNLTKKEKTYCLILGDVFADNKYLKSSDLITEYNNDFVSHDYRIIDLLNVVKYNEEKVINNQKISIHRLLKKSDIVVLSIGNNDLITKKDSLSKIKYTTINNMVNNMELLLKEIDKYYHKKVLVLGYYNENYKDNDLYTYLNYKMSKITNNQNFEYINLDKYLKTEHFSKNNQNYLNNRGYLKIYEIIVEKIRNS